MSLESLLTEDLLKRWDQVFVEYKKLAIEVKEKLKNLDKQRKELLLIREELEARNIDTDERSKKL